MAENEKALHNNGNNPGNLIHLRPGHAGMQVSENVGRKAGRPNTSTIIKRWLSAKGKKFKDGEQLTVWDEIVLAQIRKARAGSTESYNALVDRMEGKPKGNIEISGDAENPIQVGIKHEIVFRVAGEAVAADEAFAASPDASNTIDVPSEITTAPNGNEQTLPDDDLPI